MGNFHATQTMVRSYLSVSKKLDIVGEARDSGNLYATAQKHDIQPNQDREWRKKEQQLVEKKMEMEELLLFTLSQSY